jgi:hypothetical protein
MSPASSSFFSFRNMKVSHKIYALLNILVLIVVIWWNYYSNTGNIGGKTVGELSAVLGNYFTPAGYAFAIWGIIYLALVAQAIYLVWAAFSKAIDSDFISQMGPYLIMTNCLNAAWLWFWLTENTGLSVVVMLAMLFALIILILNLRMNLPSQRKTGNWLVRFPISIYAGWITVATVANISAYLAKINWAGWGISEVTWAIVMITIAALVNIFIVFSRNLIAFPLVGVWALVAISVRHAGSENILQGAALISAALILLALGSNQIRMRLKSSRI